EEVVRRAAGAQLAGARQVGQPLQRIAGQDQAAALALVLADQQAVQVARALLGVAPRLVGARALPLGAGAEDEERDGDRREQREGGGHQRPRAPAALRRRRQAGARELLLGRGERPGVAVSPEAVLGQRVAAPQHAVGPPALAPLPRGGAQQVAQPRAGGVLAP